MSTETRVRPATIDLFHSDRPGWIPEWVGDDWDPHPYAYQTREELLPAGNLHSLHIRILAEMLTSVLERLGLRCFVDVFIFYRDWEHRKQRVPADIVVAPGRESAPDESAHAYNLDIEPVPLLVVEVISPRSRKIDTQTKVLAYAALGIREYLLIDVEDEHERALDSIVVSRWRIAEGLPAQIQPDDEGYLTLETIGLRLRANGRRLFAQDIAAGEILRSNTQLLAAISAAEQARQEAEQARQEAEQARQEAEQARRRRKRRAINLKRNWHVCAKNWRAGKARDRRIRDWRLEIVLPISNL